MNLELNSQLSGVLQNLNYKNKRDEDQDPTRTLRDLKESK